MLFRSPVSSQEPLKYVFIHSASLGSQSFADVVDKGLKEAAAAFGAEYSIIENVETSAVADTLRTVIASGSHLVIIAVNTWNDPLMEVAKEYPDFPFAVLDADGTGVLSQSCSNIYEVSYREHESAFLNGVFCALMSKTGKIAQLQDRKSVV